MSKRLFVILALICAALPVASALSNSDRRAAAAASHPFATGIADQQPNMFSDPRFLSLGMKNTRIYLGWDTLLDGGQTAQTDTYMNAAHRDGIDVLVTFSNSRRPGQHSVQPTPAQLVAQMQAMRKRWPWVHEFSTWNEVNLGKKPVTVAKWWMALTKACPTCTILGADLVDRSPSQKNAGKPSVVAADLKQWLKAFLKATHGKRPKVWGLHNYVDANLNRTVGTKAMLTATKGAQIWFTETGGLVSRKNGSSIKLAEGQAHATKATKFILTKLARLSPRVKRVYLYEWTDSTTTWDSAFTGPQNQTRSSLTYLTKFLKGRR